MHNKYLKCFFISILVLILINTLFFFACAETVQYVPYESYTYWDDISGFSRKAVYNRAMYECKEVLTAKDFDIPDFNELVDVCVDKDGYVYLLDNNSRIIILDENYEFQCEIDTVVGEEDYDFIGAKSIYVDDKKNIYICDTENRRVICCDSKGLYKDIYLLPDSTLIPDEFDFRPIKVTTDTKGYVYILSEGSYYGALLYAPDKSFVGFYGSNMVTNSIIGGIESLIKRMFPNNAKSSNSKRVLPYCFADIVIDKNNFVYTATDSNRTGQIKKLSPGIGNNILGSDNVVFIDDAVNRTLKNGFPFEQKITGLDVDENGFIYCLDSTYGRIFVYDSECRMVTAIGGGMGSGTQKGTFVTASAISIKGNDILICDKSNNTLTVFERNKFGNNVFSMIHMTSNGDYLESKDGWEDVLKYDKNLQIAYTGLAKAYLANEEYDKAMSIALEGYDRDTYSLAFEYYRGEWLLNNFSIIFIVFVVFGAILLLYFLVLKKKIKVFKNFELKLLFETLIHPSKSFEIIKDKNKGSIKISIVILLIFYVVSVMKVILGGFIFTKYDPGTFNSLWVFVQSCGLVVLWTVSNWLVTTLLNGKGRIKEIFIVSAYSLVPYIISILVWIPLSNFVLEKEGVFLSILTAIGVLYSSLLLIIGMLRIHEYTMSKFLGTSILTLFGMAAIIFLAILIGILLQQLGGFVGTVLLELFM